MRIELREVRKRFGKSLALRGITATIEPGERVALIGPNGSGKSTLIRGLLGLIECEGAVLIDGRSPYENRLEVARRLAYVPQVAPQMSASVGEIIRTVALTRDLPEARIAAEATRLELDVAPIRSRPFRNLSGGMKQKLLLALALATEPQLLVLDEPAASLDARSRLRFFARLGEVPDDVTVLLCSHRLEEVEHLARRVIALEDGQVIWDGEPSGAQRLLRAVDLKEADDAIA